jgi:hypothetical protein
VNRTRVYRERLESVYVYREIMRVRGRRNPNHVCCDM